MTNAQKYVAILAEAEAIQAKQLADYLMDKAVPKELYANSGNAGVVTWTVTSVSVIGVLFPEKKPRNERVSHAEVKLAALKAASVMDPMHVILHLREANPDRKVTTGVPWARLNDRSYGYYPDRAEAEAANKLWHEEHDPRPGHFMCDYCHKQFPEAQKFRATIWRNGGQEVRAFCGNTHASYDQFASEG